LNKLIFRKGLCVSPPATDESQQTHRQTTTLHTHHSPHTHTHLLHLYIQHVWWSYRSSVFSGGWERSLIFKVQINEFKVNTIKVMITRIWWQKTGSVLAQNTLSSSDVNKAFLQRYLVFNNVLKALFIYRSWKVFFL